MQERTGLAAPPLTYRHTWVRESVRTAKKPWLQGLRIGALLTYTASPNGARSNRACWRRQSGIWRATNAQNALVWFFSTVWQSS